MDRRELLIGAAAAAPVLGVATIGLALTLPPPDPVLDAVIAGDWRTPAAKARDVWRHPAASLRFWGLKPGAVVIDVDPGGGWWTEILAPYLARTGGRYIAGEPDASDPEVGERASKAAAAFQAKFADAKLYGAVTVVGFGASSGPLAAPGTVDLVLVSRETHNWARRDGFTQTAFANFHSALRPGGVLAIEDHRAPDGADPKKGDGYISEAWVIGEAKRAGFALAARSEINANPKDTKDHPFGVWTLPPTRQSAPTGQPPNPAFDHAKYDAIGESDRMTLKFVKV
ncbi:MAG TPA: methyltransferase [Caulobacteraceae bacterium]|jgi:predicted methyltransferase|nr:methyltransferase [Caulobacteraceae bacterium]